MTLYILLAVAFFLAITSGWFYRTGLGRVDEALPVNQTGLRLLLLYLLLTIVSDIGVFVICIWALFVLNWIIVISVLFASFIFSMIFSAVLLNRMRYNDEFLIMARPLSLTIEIINAMIVIIAIWFLINTK